MAQDTAQNLVTAVERLLVEKGHTGFSVRDAAELARANVAAVGYHFGSKDALVTEVFRRALVDVTAAQAERIAAQPAELALEDLVALWLAPALNPAASDSREGQLWALIQRGAAERAPGLIEAVQRLGAELYNPLLDRLARLLPHLSARELQLRHDLILGGVASLYASGPLPSQPVIPPGAVVAWAVASLRAPASLG